MRVAIVTETFLPQVNGIVRMLAQFLAYLEADGHEAMVFAPGNGQITYHGAPIIRVSGIPCPLYPELILAPFSTRMGHLMRAWQPDVVHLAGPFVLGLHGLRVARSLDLPVAAHYQTDIARYATHFGLGALAGLAWRRLIDIHNACDANFAPTPSIARELQERGMREVYVCGRGVDTRLFTPLRRDPALRERLTAGCERPVLLYVGRLSPEKNLAALVAVAHALPEYPLLIVGDGPARGMLAAQLADLKVHFAGLLHGPDLAAAYASADLFLFPSATETFGQVVREAMASGLPTVGVRAGGVQDLIRHGETGLLCPPDDHAAYAATVTGLIANPVRRRAMGLAARSEATQYTWDSVFDHLMGWYADLARQAQLPLATVP